jgi:flagellar biosynthesis protein FliQ
MTEAELVALMRESMLVVLKLAGPMLAAGLVVGVLVSLLQAVTQVHEMTLAFIPKLLALGVALALLAPFMMSTLTTYAHGLFNRIIAIGGS